MDIDLMLKRWGKTALDRVPNDFPAQVLRVLQDKPATSYHIAILTDEELEMIDYAIDCLIKDNYTRYEIVIAYYSLECSINDIVRYFEYKNEYLSYDTIKKELDRVRNYIKGAVDIQLRSKQNDLVIKKGKAYFYA